MHDHYNAENSFYFLVPILSCFQDLSHGRKVFRKTIRTEFFLVKLQDKRWNAITFLFYVPELTVEN